MYWSLISGKDLPKEAQGVLFGLYDVQTGELIEKLYLPIKGTIRCFNGQRVTILTVMENGTFGVAHATIQ